MISQIDYSKVHLNRLLAEIELEQVTNVHIFYNIKSQSGRYANCFSEANSQAAEDKVELIRFLNN